MLRPRLPPAPSQQSTGSHRLPSPSAPGSGNLRPLFLRTIATLPSSLGLRGRIWRALTCSRETTAPANEKAQPQADVAGARPAPPLGSPILRRARRVGRRDRGKIVGRLAARVAGRPGSLRAEVGQEMSGRPRPVPRVPGGVPDRLVVGWAPGTDSESGPRWHLPRQGCGWDPSSGRFPGELSPSTCCS